MSPEVVKHLDADVTVIAFYDYENYSTDFNFDELFNKYERVHLIAWSYGVWAAWRCLECYSDRFETSIAINGTLYPISRDYGISREVFDLTLSSFSEKSRDVFYSRMCRNSMNDFMKHPPLRDVESQHRELLALRDDILKESEVDSLLFKNAFAGQKDVIVPFRSQVNWWKNRVKLQEKPFPHYPFFSWKSWNEIIEDATR